MTLKKYVILFKKNFVFVAINIGQNIGQILKNGFVSLFILDLGSDTKVWGFKSSHPHQMRLSLS